MRPTIFITQATVVPEALAILEEQADVVWGLPENERRMPSSADEHAESQRKIQSALDEAIGEIDGIFGYINYDAALIESAKKLRVIITPSSGSENVDVETATANGIAVINAAGAAYAAVAEQVIGLSLSLVKKIALPDREAHTTKQQPAISQILASTGLPGIISGKTMGVIGYGFIGREVARMAIDGFGMDVLAFDPYFDPIEADRQGVRLVADLGELLANSDIVSVNSPLTPETKDLIGAKELAQMKPTAYLINSSRGGTVATDDLVQALQNKVIAGAGLDVTEPEPLPAGHPLFDLDNVILTGHIGGVSQETLPKQSTQTAREGLMVLTGKRPFHMVNPQVWATRRGIA